jgi:NlpC/P60 family putative phage cell wall peptidase
LSKRIAVKGVLTVTEAEERGKLIAEAKTWLGTPYHTAGRVKGAGCDCGTFLLGVIENVGYLPHIDLPYYPEDIACHCAVPRYLMKIEEYCNRISTDDKKQGDILVFRFRGAKVPHHAAFVCDDEYMIHSYTRQGVILSNIRGYIPALYGAYRLKRWCE